MINQQRVRQDWIDAIKGIAIIFVIVQHFSFPSGVSSKLLAVYWAGAAVPFFMLLTGYTWSMSYSRKQFKHLENFYSQADVLKKIIRFSIPPLIVACIQVLYLLVSNQLKSVWHIFELLFHGGVGLGSYYFPMLLQLILVMPVIYFLVVKYRKKGVWLFFGLNFIYELVQNFWFLGDGAYRVLVFRYLFALACGVYWYVYGIRFTPKVKVLLFVMSACGAMVLATLQYGVDKTSVFHIIFSKWSTVSMLTILYYFPLLLLLKELFTVITPTVLATAGRASYHILFVQMIGYYFLQQFKIVVPLHYVIVLPVYIALFSVLGYWFYRLETSLNRHIQQRLKR